MGYPSSLHRVQLFLHMPSEQLIAFAGWMGYEPNTLTFIERDWKHIPYSDATVTLLFGREGVKRVRADDLLDDLVGQGFRFRELQCAYKRFPTYKEDLLLHRMELVLELDPTRAPEPVLFLASATLKSHVWERARAFHLPEPDGRDEAIVELVNPKRRRATRWTRLEFHPHLGFTATRYPTP